MTIRFTDNSGIVRGWGSFDAYVRITDKQVELYAGRLAVYQDPGTPPRSLVASSNYQETFRGKLDPQLGEWFPADVIDEVKRSIRDPEPHLLRTNSKAMGR